MAANQSHEVVWREIWLARAKQTVCCHVLGYLKNKQWKFEKDSTEKSQQSMRLRTNEAHEPLVEVITRKVARILSRHRTWKAALRTDLSINALKQPKSSKMTPRFLAKAEGVESPMISSKGLIIASRYGLPTRRISVFSELSIRKFADIHNLMSMRYLFKLSIA